MPDLSFLTRMLPKSPIGGSSILLRPPTPKIGVEIAPRRVSVVRVKRMRRGSRLVGHGMEPLPEGTIGSSLLKCSIERPEELLSALARAMEHAGARPGRASLTLPDIAGRVTLLTMPELPRSARQVEELVRFRLKRSLPYRPEDMAIAFARLTGGASAAAESNGAGVQLLTVMAIRSVVEQHESALARAGLKVGLVSLATLDLANLCRRELAAIAAPGLDAALLNCEPEYSTLAIYRSGEPIFFRCKIHLEGEEGDANRLRNLRREMSTSLSYYAEKLGGTLPLPILVRNVDPLAAELVDVLDEVELSPSHPVDVSGYVRLPADLSFAEACRLAPALGITAGRLR